MTRSQCLEALELPASASDDDIVKAYRQLAQVWHPDRFPNNAELQQKANEKLAKINAAYQALRRGKFSKQRKAARKPNPGEWFHSIDGQKAGPIEESELIRLAASGILKPDDLVWKEGFPVWLPARQIKELNAVFPPAESVQTSPAGAAGDASSRKESQDDHQEVRSTKPATITGIPFFAAIGGSIAVIMFIAVYLNVSLPKSTPSNPVSVEEIAAGKSPVIQAESPANDGPAVVLPEAVAHPRESLTVAQAPLKEPDANKVMESDSNTVKESGDNKVKEADATKVMEPDANKAAIDAVDMTEGAAQEQARKAIREQYSAELSKARKPEARVQLAKTFIETSETAADLRTRFALLAEALHLAAQGSDLELALKIAQSIADELNTAPLPWKERAAVAVGASALNADVDVAASLLTQFNELSSEAIAADEYAIAVNVMKAASDVFKKPAYKQFKEEAWLQTKQFTSLREAFDLAKGSRDKLEQDPDNAAANLVWGRFVCFYKQDWDQGFILLSRANDKVWTPLAQRELTPPETANDWLQLGDDWYSAAIKEKDSIKLLAGQRADRAWRQAVSSATPLRKKEFEQKVDQRTVKLFGSSFVSTSGDAAGAVIIGSDRYSPAESFTIEFWVSTTASKGTLLSKKQADVESSIILHLDKAVPNLSISTPSGERGSGSGAIINDGNWHHLAMVKDGNHLTLFVDGTKRTGTTLEELLVSNSPWKFGTSHNRAPCAARFGGIRISKTARYHDTFTPLKLYVKDKDTLLPP